MKRWFILLLTFSLFITTPNIAHADVSGLVPCKDSAVFKRRLDQSVKKLSARLEKYEEGTPAYLALELQIERTNARFASGPNEEIASCIAKKFVVPVNPNKMLKP